MSRCRLERDVDIFEPPTAQMIEECRVKPGEVITIGDLHGNAMRLIFTLLLHGFASGISDDDYRMLVVIYKKHVLTIVKKDIELFHGILSKLTFVQQGKLRLIGDEVCDRGSNDAFTLLTFFAMHYGRMKFESELSNHTWVFIKCIENGWNFNLTDFSSENFMISGINLQALIYVGVIDRLWVEETYKNCFAPHLKVMNYSIPILENATKPLVTLYTHAPSFLPDIRKLANLFYVEYDDKTQQALCGTIDGIKQSFRWHVAAGTLSQVPDVHRILYNFVWNRDLSRIREELFCPRRRPYDLHIVHGHDSDSQLSILVTNLDKDNLLGKQEFMKDGRTIVWNNEGVYRWYVDVPTVLNSGYRMHTLFKDKPKPKAVDDDLDFEP